MGSHPDLEDLIKRIKAAIEQLPPDIDPRSLTVTIGRDNLGNISTGPTISIPLPDRRLEDLAPDELQQEMGEARKIRAAARRSMVLNWPLAMLLFITTGAMFSFQTNLFSELFGAGSILAAMDFPLFAFFILFLGLRARHQYGVEMNIIAMATQKIERIQTILRIREHAAGGR